MPDSPRPRIPASPPPEPPGLASLRVLLVDDHPLFLEGLHNLLDLKGIQVVGAAGDGLEALEKARSLCPGVILMDVDMPRCDGLAATRLIKAELPEIKIVMLTMSEDDHDLFEAVKSGASGYLLKKLKPDTFFALLADSASPFQVLTPRQVQILTLVAQGQIYRQVAETLGLSEPTVKYHMGEILDRLHLENREQVIAYAARQGMTRGGEDTVK